MVFGSALDRLQKKGIEKIVRASVANYAKKSGVLIDVSKVTIDFSDDDYRVQIPYTAQSQDQLARFQDLLQHDKYLRGHL